jgi:hypothetical protein
METIYKFLLWVVCSFVVLIMVSSLIPNKVIFSFIIAVAFGFAVTLGETRDG